MNQKKTIVALLTCFNRKQHTIECIRSLIEGNKNLDFQFVVVDDKSSDGTVDELKKLPYNILILLGTGQFFWNGGMQMAIDYVHTNFLNKDYYLWVNDDVQFFHHAIENLIDRHNKQKNTVVVGSTQDASGNMSYGGVRKESNWFARFSLVEPSEDIVKCDTFNGNCVLIPNEVFLKAGNVDSYYMHSMGDFDYGMKLSKMGIVIINAKEHVGRCNDNAIQNTWRDSSLPRKKRIELKETNKGLPTRDWFYFIRKNYGIVSAIYHSVTPYIRIIIGK